MVGNKYAMLVGHFDRTTLIKATTLLQEIRVSSRQPSQEEVGLMPSQRFTRLGTVYRRTVELSQGSRSSFKAIKQQAVSHRIPAQQPVAPTVPVACREKLATFQHTNLVSQWRKKRNPGFLSPKPSFYLEPLGLQQDNLVKLSC